MVSEETILITRYISSWGWHLIAVMFLIQVVNFLLIDRYVWAISMGGVMFIAELMAMVRKREVFDSEEDDT